MNRKSLPFSLIREIRYFRQKPKSILFDHLPKCGGSGMKAFLKHHYPQRLVFQTNGTKPHESVKYFKALPKEKKLKYQLIVGHLANELIADANPKAFKITVLRDPIDRIISHYFYAKQEPSHHLHQRIVEEKISLAEYTGKGLSGELTNWYTSHFSGMSPDVVLDEPVMAVSTALENLLESYDLVGFQDNIQGFLEKLKTLCQLSAKLPDARSNVTKSRKGVERLSEEELTGISKNNALDIELFDRLKKAMAERESSDSKALLDSSR